MCRGALLRTYHRVPHSPSTLGLLPEPEYMGLQNILDNGAEKNPHPERRNVLFGHTPAATCRVLVPWLGIEPMPIAKKAWSPNHWTAWKFSKRLLVGKHSRGHFLMRENSNAFV